MQISYEFSSEQGSQHSRPETNKIKKNKEPTKQTALTS